MTTTGTGSVALLLDNVVDVDVDGAGFATSINVNGGWAIFADNLAANGTSLVFDSVSVANGSGNGVVIAGNSDWTFTANGGLITNTPAPLAFLGGSGDATYAGDISNGGSDAVAVVNRSGNTTISGNITGAGGGITVTNSDAPGITTFSGATKAVSSGPSAGVTLTNNTGHTINFTGGGLDIDTTSGTGFSATGGGVVTVTGANNSVATGTGGGINVDNTAIGGAGMTFASVSSNGGAAPGINLNNTGTGGFTVTGDGGGANNGSGGTINGKSVSGVNLSGVDNVRLSYMNITNNLGDGISGADVNGFVLNRDNITGNGDTTVTDNGVELTALTGSGQAGANPTSVTNTALTNNKTIEFTVSNTAGTLTDLQWTNNTVSADGASGGHGNMLSFLGAGTANMTLNVNGGSWTGATPNTATAVHADTDGGTMTTTVTGGTFTSNNVAVSNSVSHTGSTNFDINGITATGNRAHGINVFTGANPPFGAATVVGKIRNNVVGTLGAAGSGAQLGIGIRVQNEGAYPATIAITNNTVQEISAPNGFQGINVNQGISGAPAALAGGLTSMTITGNTVREIDNSRAIVVAENTTPANNVGSTCVDISGNSFSNIAGQAGDGSFMRVRQLTGSYRVEQAQPTAAANLAELDDANGFNDPTKVNVSGTITFSGAACPTPP